MLGTHYPFPLLIEALDEVPGRQELFDALVLGAGQGVERTLMEYPDHAELLDDAFLTPLLMEMAKGGNRRERSVLEGYGYGWNTPLQDPDSGEHTLTLAQWAAGNVPVEQLTHWAEDDDTWRPWETQSVPSARHTRSGNLFLSPAQTAMLVGFDPDAVEWWHQAWEARAKTLTDGPMTDDRAKRQARRFWGDVIMMINLARGFRLAEDQRPGASEADQARAQTDEAQFIDRLWPLLRVHTPADLLHRLDQHDWAEHGRRSIVEAGFRRWGADAMTEPTMLASVVKAGQWPWLTVALAQGLPLSTPLPQGPLALVFLQRCLTCTENSGDGFEEKALSHAWQTWAPRLRAEYPHYWAALPAAAQTSSWSNLTTQVSRSERKAVARAMGLVHAMTEAASAPSLPARRPRL